MLLGCDAGYGCQRLGPAKACTAGMSEAWLAILEFSSVFDTQLKDCLREHCCLGEGCTNYDVVHK